MDDVLIRDGGPGDAPEITRLLIALCAHEGDPVDHLTQRHVARDICGPDRALSPVVAEAGPGRLWGVALWRSCYETSYAARGGFLSDLFVDAEARRHGLGQRLVAAVAAAVQGEGGTFLWLTARAENARANAFYRDVMNIHQPRITAHALTHEAFADLARSAQAPR